MREITSLDELKELADSQGQRLYVRYTSNIESDIKRGYSLNHASGQSEAGLSVENLPQTDDVLGNDIEQFARQVASYSFMRMGQKIRGYVLRGQEVGRGSDNEPLLADIEIVARLSPECVEEAAAIERERTDAKFKKLGWEF